MLKEKILLADDVEELAKTVGDILKYNNYEVDVVFNGKKALEMAKKNLYDCIILDVMMPIMDGLEALKNIRDLDTKTPIILLTAKDLLDDKVKGLDAGANDYITKPFEYKELLARIRALTRIKKEKEEKFFCGNVIFDKENSEIYKDNITLHLSKKECEIMEILIKNKGRKISNEELKQRVWTNKDGDSNIVLMYITYLQEKFLALNANIKISNENGYSIENINL